MRKLMVAGMLACLLSSNNAFAQSRSKKKTVNPRVGQTYNPAYGYSNRTNNYNYYRGNSAPYQGTFRFAPGFGYGSIYGNSGHPGFNRFSGPAWASPYAWGR